MRAVQPIRDFDVIEAIANDLMASNPRDHAVFLVGIYTGLRISDILKLRVSDLRKNEINVRQRKNKKWVTLPINYELRKGIAPYLEGKPDNEPLFVSRQVQLKVRIRREINRSTVYRILNKAAGKYGLSSIGCHTMRKTFGYHLYNASEKNIGLIMDIFGHSDPSITLRYIGVTQDSINAAILNFKYRQHHK